MATITLSSPMPSPPENDVVVRLRGGVEHLLNQGQSYAEIQIAALLKESGVARSTFYARFSDKHELLRVLAAGVMQDLVEFDDAWWILPPDATREQTHEALVLMSEAYAAHGALMAAIVEATIYDREMRAQFETLMGGAIEATATYLREGQRAGTVPADLDARRTAHWLTWMLERGFNRLLRGGGGAVRKRRLEAMTDIVWSTAREGAA